MTNREKSTQLTPEQQLQQLRQHWQTAATDPLSCLERLSDLLKFIHNTVCQQADQPLGLWVVTEEAQALAEIAFTMRWIEERARSKS